jgi:hypothetical protein
MLERQEKSLSCFLISSPSPISNLIHWLFSCLSNIEWIVLRQLLKLAAYSSTDIFPCSNLTNSFPPCWGCPQGNTWLETCLWMQAK